MDLPPEIGEDLEIVTGDHVLQLFRIAGALKSGDLMLNAYQDEYGRERVLLEIIGWNDWGEVQHIHTAGEIYLSAEDLLEITPDDLEEILHLHRANIRKIVTRRGGSENGHLWRPGEAS